MQLTHVVWVVSAAGTDLDAMMATLLPRGFTVEPCLPGASRAMEGELRVLPWYVMPATDRMGEYESDLRPTLVVVSNCEEEACALDVIRPGDTVGRSDDSHVVFARRLAHLKRQAQELRQLRHSIDTDSLTGLMNRKRFETMAKLRFRDLAPEDHWAIVMLDLDRFKRINDQFGHTIGDGILQLSADRLRSALESADILARYGGEEFVAMIQRPSRRALESAAVEMLRSVSSKPFDASPWGWTGQPIDVTASAGLTYLERGHALEGALQEADQALYDAKAKGRNRLTIYELLEAQAISDDSDVQLLHFQNVTRVVTERTTDLVTLFGSTLVQSARRDAMRDKLTQMWNRRYFDQRIHREIELVRKDGRRLTLAMMDIDHFGNFNRAYGLPTGDAVLKTFGLVAASCIRQVDWIARYGGEEFALIVPGSEAEAAVVAERIRSTLEARDLAEFTRDSIRVTVSVGLAEYTPDTGQVVDLIQKASDALRVAKRSGRNRVHGCSTRICDTAGES